MRNCFLFLYQRSGSELITKLIEHRTQEEIKRVKKLRDRGVFSSEPRGILHSLDNPPCRVEHITGPKLLNTIKDNQDSLPYRVWYTYIWNWWGEVNAAKEVPDPYIGECPWRWGKNELLSLPGENWRFVVQVRDPRNLIESVRFTEGERGHPLQIQNPEEYFAIQCAGARNRARVILDAAKAFPSNYFIMKFEDLIFDPIIYTSKLLGHFGFSADIKAITRAYSKNQSNKKYLVKHSSFHEIEHHNQRWHRWSKQEVDVFKHYANKELEELGYKW